MKTKIVVLASVLLVLTALTFLVPVGVLRATMETKACPGPICIINEAQKGPNGPEGLTPNFCRGYGGAQCAYCCEIFSNCEKIVGTCGACILGDTYNDNCYR